MINNIEQLEQYIKTKYQNEASGHDWFHIYRVTYLALNLAQPQDDCDYIKLLALLHEELDDKLNPDDALQQLKNILADHHIESSLYSRLIKDIQSIGFKGGFHQVDRTREAMIVSDADLLDAMGAIGIARTFQYNGQVKHAPFYDPALAKVELNNYADYRQKKRNAIAHFDEKLLRLKDLIVTDKGQKLANKRHQRMVQFVEDFFSELAESGVDISDRFLIE